VGEKKGTPGPDLKNSDPNRWRADLDEMLDRVESVLRPKHPLGRTVTIYAGIAQR
jgi:hypothetical protein